MKERTVTADRDDRGTAQERAGGRDDSTSRASRRDVLRTTGGAVGAGVVGLVGATGAATADGGSTEGEGGGGGGGGGQSTRDVMFTCNARDGSVSLIDAHTLERIDTISVYPDEDDGDPVSDAVDEQEPRIINAFARRNYLEHVNVSPDGRTIYASRGHAGDVAAFDVETHEKRWETELPGFRADHQIISHDGDYLFTSNLTSDRVEKIDTETGRIVAGAPVRDLPHGLHYHHLPAFDDRPMVVNGSLGNMVYPDTETGDHMAHRLTFVDPETMLPERTVDFEEGVRPIAITSDGRKAYVQLSYFHGFHVYDIERDEITRTKKLPRTEHVPESESDYPLQSAHHGITLSGDDEYVVVAGTTSWYVAIVRRSDLSLVDTIHVGEHPYWVKTGPTGDRGFVPVRGENEVAVIDYEAAEEIGRVEVGRQPHVTEYSAVPRDIL